MEKLIDPGTTADILKKFDFHFQKRYGQNFLIDENVLYKIIDAARITKDDFVLEVGPGIGTMTQALSEAAGRVMAVEIDKNLIPVLEYTLKDRSNVTIVNEDIMKLNIRAVAEEYNGGRPIKVAANLPYYITTPVIMYLFEAHVPLESITVMVQKEVADRMKASPGGKDYGALSVAVQHYSVPEAVGLVPPNCFIPRPKVTSQVINLRMDLTEDEKRVRKVKDEEKMFDLVKAAFGQRRKTLVNAVLNSGSFDVTRLQLEGFLKNMGLDASVRGEKLSPQQFIELSEYLP
ncbi:MAG: 16S rRNA (adenine(1518)-N(6)/adenine(1519)-N(6))-dimethyltransferase RsmA [Lachnospiraceae bacterium]|jgi:16S rRNA (adenine1518-N6/adenine1519-N6)-dimethyltransferase|nr:16S rRNA (adenine(1518)-N(6)/adenine(1519)-N(6))-dimethyltransferase RsmA [Lachnospiraceae bacterium]MEE3460300.1 16S rRNA (adenine(1518)-N(6)/adenine(1519)-N(6))-dimethyltransferase RsmA [Lachnospiraceae bacterium]